MPGQAWSFIALHSFASIGVAVVLGCTDTGSTASAASVVATPDSDARDSASLTHWQVRRLDAAPDGFRPAGWSSEDVLWGSLRDRVARLDARTGAVTTLPHSAWSIHTSSGVVAWRNERGTWLMRDGGEAVLIAGASDPATGFDGPPSPLLSPNGDRALLEWQGEWDSVYDLVDSARVKRRLVTRIPGYYGNDAAVWRKQTRVLFHVVAKGPMGGEPQYRESGWRGDIAELDLATGAYKRLTSVPDGITLRIAGWHPGGLLVSELDDSGVRGHWLYHPGTWQRRAMDIPKGRAFASGWGAVVVLPAAQTDTTTAVLWTPAGVTQLGRVAQDAEPAFSGSGRRGVLRTSAGLMLFESQPVPAAGTTSADTGTPRLP